MKDQLLQRFEQYEIRGSWYRGEWWYSVIDVVKALTGSTDPSAYWRKLKQRLRQEGSEVVTNCHGLKLRAKDGKMRKTDCASREVLLRLIQSIPSPKAEPFKLWLAQVGEEKIQETENPEKALEHLTRIYRALGRDEEWIEARLRSVQVRKQLTDEWLKRGVKKGEGFARLTAIISKGIFGLTPAEHKKLK